MIRETRQNRIMEWVGPLCCRLGISKSMSGMTDDKNSKGRLTSTLKILEVVFPQRCPKARWPGANIDISGPFILAQHILGINWPSGSCTDRIVN